MKGRRGEDRAWAVGVRGVARGEIGRRDDEHMHTDVEVNECRVREG
jgi:hypothetical protein